MANQGVKIWRSAFIAGLLLSFGTSFMSAGPSPGPGCGYGAPASATSCPSPNVPESRVH